MKQLETLEVRVCFHEKADLIERLQEIEKESLSLNKELIKLQEDINAIS